MTTIQEHFKQWYDANDDLTLRAAFNAGWAAARVQENERLAKHFDAKPGCEMFGGGVADEIRILLEKEPT